MTHASGPSPLGSLCRVSIAAVMRVRLLLVRLVALKLDPALVGLCVVQGRLCVTHRWRLTN